jgi:signal transduction histidine kinase
MSRSQAFSLRGEAMSTPIPLTMRKRSKQPSEDGRLPDVPRWVRELLRVPLIGKIAGANALIVVAAIVVALVVVPEAARGIDLLVVMGAALGLSLLVNMVLLVLALRPLGDLEGTARRIWKGELGARVPFSLLADAEIRRVGGTINALLDSLEADRERMRALASQVIKAGDVERARIARELHDSACQTLAALVMELGVLRRTAESEPVAVKVERLRDIAGGLLDELKLLAHTVHPRVLEDLGLVAALELLAREAGERCGVRVRLDVDAAADAIPRWQAPAMYRVAQEAVNNAARHASAREVTVRLTCGGGQARLQVEDDGVGFDVEDAVRRRPGMGLFTMRERAELAGGACEIRSAPGTGTRVVVTMPVAANGGT